MNAVNAVQLFLLVWSYSAVCNGDKGGCSVSCDDVTGTVGKEVIFTCRRSEQMTKDCVNWYKFQYPANYNDSEICRLPVGVCEKGNIFTCRYTPYTTIKGTFRFFGQGVSCTEKKEFTVDISAGPKKSTADTEAPIKEEEPIYAGPSETRKEEKQDRGFKLAVILAVVSCFIIVIIVVVFKVKKRDSTRRRLRCEESDSKSLDNV